MKEISLYIHIPFCAKKCYYCDFNSYVAPELVPSYLEALKKEILLYRHIKQPIKTIYIGGGTPTVLTEKDLEALIDCVARHFHIKSGAEFTVEANPGTLTRRKLLALKTLGVNRLSLGLQAHQDRLLKALGRIHSAIEFEECLKKSREAGFDNINVDVIFGLPGQTVSDFIETLEYITAFLPEHISCYSLTIEKGTKFYEMREKGLLQLPSDEEEREMYHKAVEYLTHRGFIHYEISNFAVPGRMCRHNISCWKYEDYLGLGAGAHSFMQGRRFYNHPSPLDYIRSISQNMLPVENMEYLDIMEQRAEFCFLGLRLIEGLDKQDFKRRFGKDIHEVYGAAIQKLSSTGLVEEDGERIKLTPKGLDLANEVFVEFLP
ncbi:MAG: hypothetical protein PWQ97_811 [Tepidanaerobacteraceae bacterium]|nr:hypothetical protein [Tepidanaerobacteraceae bacterium]